MSRFNLSLVQFKRILTSLNAPKEVLDIAENIYDMYLSITEGVDEFSKDLTLKFSNVVNPLIVIFYILYELNFRASLMELPLNEAYKKIFENEDEVHHISSVICDKYLTNEKFNYKSTKFLNRFNPLISTLNLYLNFVLNVVNRNDFNLNPNQRLVRDLLKNCFNLVQCIANLLVNGFEVEAFSTWRTTHENECILYLLVKNGPKMFDAYRRHIQYSLAYRNTFDNKEKTDQIFSEIKENMKKHDLKSKDMKKFIEYGYLFELEDKEYLVDYKLNFRDGVEKMAGLGAYSKTYELSSEIAHSSPLLIYSNREYYFSLTMINLYESFFRLEGVFFTLYKTLVSNEIFNSYVELRNEYLKELALMLNVLRKDFNNRFIKNQRHDNKNHQ